MGAHPVSLLSLPRLLGLLGLAGLVLTPAVAAAPRAAGAATMVQLTKSGACTESVALTRAGAREIDARLRLWRLEPALAASAVPELRARDAIVFAQKERTYRVAATTDTPDPLQSDEWWLSQIGISGLTAPGPGVPVTIVDSGLDVAHPEFLGRADTQALNAQEPAPFGGEHGTMVSSVIAAPVNGVGLVGIYPRAVLRSWDAAKGDGTRLESSEISAGLLAAARTGRSVINLSLGSDASDLSIELAVDEAVASGSLVVAASGNDGDRGSPLGYPAAYPHVTTVAATDRSGAVAPFSSRSRFVDLAAPGDDIIVASALGQDWTARVRHELLLSDGRCGRGLGLDGATRADCRPGGRGPSSLRDGHRAGGARPGLRVRHAERRRRARPAGADPRSVRAERRRRPGRPERRPIRVEAAGAQHGGEALRAHRGAESTGTRIRGTSSVSGSPPPPASPRRSPRRATATSRSTRPPRGASSAGSPRTADSRSQRPRERASASCIRTRARVAGGTWPCSPVPAPSTPRTR